MCTSIAKFRYLYIPITSILKITVFNDEYTGYTVSLTYKDHDGEIDTISKEEFATSEDAHEYVKEVFNW